MTDLNLLELKSRHPGRILVERFSKVREGTIGADWEWWIISGSRHIGLRVQAKTLDARKLTYSKLGYVITKSNRKTKQKTTIPQVDALMADAVADPSMPRVALYCFYNSWDDATHSAIPRNCSQFRSPHDHGCTIASAAFVKSLIATSKKDLHDVAQRATPWACLVCCGRSTASGDLVDGAREVLVERLGVSPNQIITDGPLPSYVRRLISGESTETPENTSDEESSDFDTSTSPAEVAFRRLSHVMVILDNEPEDQDLVYMNERSKYFHRPHCFFDSSKYGETTLANAIAMSGIECKRCRC